MLVVASRNILVRYGLRQILKPLAVAISEADNLDDLLAQVRRNPVDVVIFALGPQAISDEDALKHLSRSHLDTRLVAIAPLPSRQQMIEVMEAGAHGYVGESDTPSELVDAVRRVRAGQTYIPLSLAPVSSTMIPVSEPPPTAELKLSSRQRQLLPLIAQGLSNKAIALTLDISVSTAKFHVGSLLRILNSSNRTEAASKATLLLR